MFGPLACLLLTTADWSGCGCQPAPHFGQIWQPAFTLDTVQRAPALAYEPNVGDLLICNCRQSLWKLAYRFALTGPPTHVALVVRTPDGKLAQLEAGIGFQLFVEVTPLEQRLADYDGTIYVRRRKVPLTEAESTRLSDFAAAVQKKTLPPARYLIQVTPLRARGPLRTDFASGPRGIRRGYMCSELVVETLVAADLLDADTARPTATYPCDFFFDHSTNPYLNRHLIPALNEGWHPPALWTKQ